MTCAIEPDVFEGLFSRKSESKGKNSLIRLTELSGSGKHTASVDPYWEVKAFTVLRIKVSEASFDDPWGVVVGKSSESPTSCTINITILQLESIIG